MSDESQSLPHTLQEDDSCSSLDLDIGSMKKHVYTKFNRAIKETLRTMGKIVPSLSTQLATVVMLVKVTKHIGIKWPYKYYIELIDTPYNKEIVAQNTNFFMNDPQFDIVGFSDITADVKCELRNMTTDQISSMWKLINSINEACNDVKHYRALRDTR